MPRGVARGDFAYPLLPDSLGVGGEQANFVGFLQEDDRLSRLNYDYLRCPGARSQGQQNQPGEERLDKPSRAFS